MLTPDLDLLTPTLQKLSSAEVRPPSGMPISTFLAEAETFNSLIARTDVSDGLKKVGTSDERLAILPTAVQAARQAQSVWAQQRGRRNSEVFNEAIKRGEALRTQALKACKWNLRHDAEIQANLKFIRQTGSIATLAQDLHDLARLLEMYPLAFESDQTFDSSSVVIEARQIASTLMDEKSEYHHGISQHSAKDMRDRAFTYLNELLSEFRKAGEYAFRDNPEMAKRFTSRYWRSQNHRVAISNPELPAEPGILVNLAELQNTSEPAQHSSSTV
ncbi:hypothetical protein [Bradymonas sediminis]|nr:hypothetical protein [Bradymonas sediminis]TDP75925.1 hypothetical protein DFR33_103274 [Bradymonas sediminis]